MRRRAFLLVVSILASMALAGCGGPSIPDGTVATDRVQLQTGPYSLFFSSSATVCAAQGPINPSFELATRVTLTHESSEWVARSSSSADGDLELRFHDAGGADVAGAVTVAGTIRGSGGGSNDPPSVNRAISFTGTAGAATAEMQGTTTTSLSPAGALGGVSGSITLVTNPGGVVTCSSVALSLSRTP